MADIPPGHYVDLYGHLLPFRSGAVPGIDPGSTPGPHNRGWEEGGYLAREQASVYEQVMGDRRRAEAEQANGGQQRGHRAPRTPHRSA